MHVVTSKLRILGHLINLEISNKGMLSFTDNYAQAPPYMGVKEIFCEFSVLLRIINTETLSPVLMN